MSGTSGRGTANSRVPAEVWQEITSNPAHSSLDPGAYIPLALMFQSVLGFRGRTWAESTGSAIVTCLRSRLYQNGRSTSASLAWHAGGLAFAWPVVLGWRPEQDLNLRPTAKA